MSHLSGTKLIFHACALLLGLADAGAPPLRAQQQIVVAYQPGGPATNGYAEARIPIRYSFLACNNELHIEFAFRPSDVRTSATYWYQGKSYTVPTGTSSPPIYGIQIAAALERRGVRLAEFLYATHPGSLESSCVTSTNVTSVGDLRTFGVDVNDRNGIRDYFKSLVIPQTSVKSYDYALRNVQLEDAIGSAAEPAGSGMWSGDACASCGSGRFSNPWLR